MIVPAAGSAPPSNPLSGRLLFWLPALTFVLHSLEELPGFARWATDHFAPLGQAEFAIFHIPLIWIVTFVSYRAWCSPLPSAWRFWAASFQWQFAFNALFHLASALAFREYAPGMVTAATIALPATLGLTIGVIRSGLLGKAEMFRAILVGAALAIVAIGTLFV